MTEKQKSRPWLTWLVIVLVLLVAYPLSMGPMIRLAIKGYLPDWFVELPVYYPLQLLEDRSPPIHRLFDWYEDWWTEI